MKGCLKDKTQKVIKNTSTFEENGDEIGGKFYKTKICGRNNDVSFG